MHSSESIMCQGKDETTSLIRRGKALLLLRRRNVASSSDEDCSSEDSSSTSAASCDSSAGSDDDKGKPRTAPKFVSEPSLRALKKASFKIDDPVEYSNKRQMSVAQERANALSIIPASFYCAYYLVTTVHWVPPEIISEAQNALNGAGGKGPSDVNGCISSWVFPYLRYLPPPTVLAIGVGTILHTPASFLYHWKYCTDPNVPNKIDHWSRRLDQCLVHFTGALWSYGTSASLSYFTLNLLYNLDCIRLQCQPAIIPRRNQVRILLCVVLYTAPLVFMSNEFGEEGLMTFLRFWKVFLWGVFFFVAYPFGGWSHTMFHLVTISLPAILMSHAVANASDWTMNAAKCAAVSSSLSM